MRLIAILALALASCATGSSEFMRRGVIPPSARPDLAMIVFVGDTHAPGLVHTFTVLDENNRFVGELFEHHLFAAQVSPGRHTFHIVDIRATRALSDVPPPWDCGMRIDAEVLPSRVYVAWLRWDDPNHSGRGFRLLIPRPDGRLLDPSSAKNTWDGHRFRGPKPELVVDPVAGQRWVDDQGARICTPDSGRALTAQMRPEDGFATVPWLGGGPS